MLRGRPGQPEFGVWMTLKWGCTAASSSNRAGVSSVDPSSTKIASNWSLGNVCTVSDLISGSMYAPALYDGTTTLTFLPTGTTHLRTQRRSRPLGTSVEPSAGCRQQGRTVSGHAVPA